MINVVHTGIVSAPLDAAAIHAAVHDERCGATAVFRPPSPITRR